MKKVKILIMFFLVFFLYCCDKNDNNINIWTRPATEKILLDNNYPTTFKNNKDISIDMVRGEYESFQILITPEKKVKEYDVKISELKTQTNQKISKDNIAIYNQKYLEVKTGTIGGMNGPLGFYPDALLPFETAKEYKENYINSNNNQGIWITVKTDINQQPGLYEGIVKITCDNKTYSVDIEVNVFDYQLDETNTAKSIFPIERDSLIYGEYDNSMEMYKTYVDELLEYRMAAYLLPARAKDIPNYIEVATSYAKNIKSPSYAIPVYQVYNEAVNDIDIDYHLLENYILAMARESIKSGVDLISKSYIYIGIIDEPEMGQIIPRAQRITSSVTKSKEKCAEMIRNDLSLDEIERNKYADKILNISNIVTNKKIDSLEGYVDTWAPLFDDLDSINRREEYKNDSASLWWYGCIGPKNPYPTYHIDDNLISSRVLSWMQNDYDIEGNLYWETALYQKAVYNDELGSWQRIPTDAYKEASRFPDVNGDGFLIYPGTPYGLKKPVASIRMHSIRDGLEEYEILKDLENTYQKVFDKNNIDTSTSTDDILQLLYKKLYNGTKVITNSDTFKTARKELIQLAVLAKGNPELVVSNVKYNESSIELEVYIKDNFDLKVDNDKVEYQKYGNLKKYLIEYNMEKLENNTSIKVYNENENYELNIFLGGKTTVVSQFVKGDENIIEVDGINSVEIINGEDVQDSFTGSYAKIHLNQDANNIQTFRLETELFEEIGTNTQLIYLNIYNPSTENVNLAIYFEGSDNPIYKLVYNGTLKPGMNFIEINNIYNIHWDDFGNLKKIHFDIGSKNDDERILYIDYISYIDKGVKQ